MRSSTITRDGERYWRGHRRISEGTLCTSIPPSGGTNSICQVIMEKEFTTIATNSVVNVTVITNTIKKGVSCSLLASLHCNSGWPFLEYLQSIRANWYNFGLQLKVNIGILDGIADQYSNPLDCLHETLKHWLKTSSNCTWKCIVNALSSSIVGANALALEIERKYCPQLNTHEPQGQYQSTHTSQPPHIPPFPSVTNLGQQQPLLSMLDNGLYLCQTSQIPPMLDSLL